MNHLNLVLDLYIDGYPIEIISKELLLSEEEVLNYLRSFKTKERNGKDYIKEFKELIVERILSGVKKGRIAKELGVAYKTINKYLEEFNVDMPKNRKELEGLMFNEIDWKSFTECPTCHNKRVNDLNIYKEEGLELRNSYCLKCGTEWLEKSNKVFKVNWEYVG